MCRLRVRSRPDESLPFTDGRDAFAFNGEIYAANGVVPAGGTDEAVAVSRNDDSHVDGMYALVRRSPDGVLHIARDRFGIKPLYLSSDSAGVEVASEIPAFGQLLVPSRVRADALAQFLLFGRVIDGGTWFSGLNRVRPGERIRIRAGRIEQRQRRPIEMSQRADPEMVRTAVEHAVDRVLVSDRTIGLAISGGLDSTILAYTLARSGISDLRTVSVVPDGTGDGVRSLEQLGLPGSAWRSWRHRWVRFGPSDLLDGIPDAVAALGEPTAMTSVPMYASLARLARDAEIVVLLLGEGADELFGGYRSYLRLDSAISARAYYLSDDRVRLVRGLVGPDACADALDSLRAALPDGHDAIDVVRRFEVEHSLEPLLQRADCLLMTRGVEGRTPFLHGGLAELAGGLPWHTLVDGHQTKVVLRHAYADALPHFIAEVKKPFRAPAASWMAGPLRMRLAADMSGHADRLGQLGIRARGVAELIRALDNHEPQAAPLAFAVLAVGAWLVWLDGQLASAKPRLNSSDGRSPSGIGEKVASAASHRAREAPEQLSTAPSVSGGQRDRRR